MLPTPSTSHVDFDRIYEPAEDSYLLLDTLSSSGEIAFLTKRFGDTICPLICEVGTGSGVVLAFIAAQCKTILGREDAMILGTDINSFACRAAEETVTRAMAEGHSDKSTVNLLSIVNADLTSAIRHATVDILIFNPPYVPAPLPDLSGNALNHGQIGELDSQQRFDRDSHLLSLSYAGGEDGMEVTNRLLAQLPEVLTPGRGVAYVLLCAQNKPDEIQRRIEAWPGGWSAAIVGSSGKQAGWEKLIILRICRTATVT